MSNYKQLTLRISEEAHQELKMISAMTKKSMTELILEMLDDYKKQFAKSNEFIKLTNQFFKQKQQSVSELEQRKMEKEAKERKKSKLINKIVELRNQDMTFEEIANTLQLQGVKTISGKGKWQKGTIYKLFKEAEEKPAQTALDKILSNAKWKIE